ncbi:type II toxin-antitoxin system RelE/ParE family toxin [Mesorhizobium sp. M0915]|uniref:type II toxin-antitoxin system RelE/ParE family toxin n=1 Tax=Mesorhizobium sp. M0915 TaxID=2957027 RepID=UPI0033365A6A
MKELRFEASNGEWRAAFAFDPERKALLLVAAIIRRESQALLQAAYRESGSPVFRPSEKPENHKEGK